MIAEAKKPISEAAAKCQVRGHGNLAFGGEGGQPCGRGGSGLNPGVRVPSMAMQHFRNQLTLTKKFGNLDFNSMKMKGIARIKVTLNKCHFFLKIFVLDLGSGIFGGFHSGSQTS